MKTRWIFVGMAALVLVCVAVYGVAAGPQAPNKMPGMPGIMGGPPACCSGMGMHSPPTNPDVARTFATVQIIREYLHQRGKPFDSDDDFAKFVHDVNIALK